jgi:hypothetical protein
MIQKCYNVGLYNTTFRKHERPLILVRIGSYVLPQTTCFKFEYIFQFWVAMELPCEICTAKMPPKGELVEIGGRGFLGSASILFDTAV